MVDRIHPEHDGPCRDINFDPTILPDGITVSDDPFPEPASVRKMAGELYVTEAAVKQHLQNMYDKFAIPTEGDRRVRLANEALRRGAVTIAQLRGGLGS